MSSDRKMPDDRELEDFLAGRHPVGKAYREASEHETAPPELDAAILRAARESVRTPRARRPRWFQPVAVAATLALSLGVLLNIWRDPETRGQMAPAESSDLDRMKAEVLEERALSAVVEAKKEAGPGTTVAPEPPAAPDVPSREVEAEIEPRSDAAAARRESKSLQRDEPRKAKEGAAMNSADAVLSAGAAAPKAQAPVPASSKPEPSPPEASRSAPAASAGSSSGFVPEPPAAAPPPPPPAPITAPSPGAQRAAPLGAAASRTFDDRVEQQAPRDESKDAKRARDFAAPAMSGARSGVASEEDGTATGALAPRAPSVTSPVAPAAKSSQPEAEADSDSFAPAPPEDWIRRIRELRDGGDITAAWSLLESFRARYPDYVLPKDLRDLQPP